MTVISPPGAAEDAPRVLLIDNYDSFTYNLAHLLCESGAVVDVRRHDAVDARRGRRARADAPRRLPRPRPPQRGGRLGRADRALRRPRARARASASGTSASSRSTAAWSSARAGSCTARSARSTASSRTTLLAGLPESFEAGRYHSLAAIEPLPAVLVATARDRDGEVMALRHRDIPHLHGVQFHPESVLTPAGDVIARNFLAMGSAA